MLRKLPELLVAILQRVSAHEERSLGKPTSLTWGQHIGMEDSFGGYGVSLMGMRRLPPLCQEDTEYGRDIRQNEAYWLWSSKVGQDRNLSPSFNAENLSAHGRSQAYRTR